MRRVFSTAACLNLGCVILFFSPILHGQTTDTGFTATSNGYTSNSPTFGVIDGGYTTSHGGGFTANNFDGGADVGFISNAGGGFVANDNNGLFTGGFTANAPGGFVDNGGGGFVNNGFGGFVDNGGGGFTSNGGGIFTFNSPGFGTGIPNTAIMFNDTSFGPFGPVITQSYGLTPGPGVPFLDFDTPGTPTQSGFQAIHLDGSAGTNSLVVHPNGVGVGLGGWALGGPVPRAALHVFSDGGQSVGGTSPYNTGEASILVENTTALVQDRNMLSLENNGSVFMNLNDKSPTGSQWQIFTTQGRFSLRKAGANTPGMTIRQSGDITFANLGQSIMNLNPVGNLFVRGNINTFGTVNGVSDRNMKENIKAVDPQEILARVAELPISTWNYIHDEKDIPHMGPMAQDFRRSFGLGEDDKSIAFIDKDGVTLAAIQGLYQNDAAKDQKLVEMDEQLKKQSKVISSQDELIAELTDRLEQLESVVSSLEQK